MLDQILNFINHNMMTATGMITVSIEFALRMVKSNKPLSIIYIVADGIKKVGAICNAIGVLLDKVLPQRLNK
jgi:DNA-binding HxlR family transcriptional regulator